MSELRIGARDFAVDPLGAKNKARDGATVVITNRGRPDLAMVSYERWKALEAAMPQSALEGPGTTPGKLDRVRGASYRRPRSGRRALMARVLLATNVVSELRKGRRCHRAVAAWQSGIDLQALFLSVVTLLELRLRIALEARQDEAAADGLLDWYQKSVKPTFAGRILGVDERIAERCALLHVPLTRRYRDSLIAATAAEHGLIDVLDAYSWLTEGQLP